jgi:uncharacterized MAPEG superfamily protein
MRQTFDSKTPWHVAIARAQAKKKPGRKHNHQPRGRAMEKRLSSPRRRQALEATVRRKWSALVSAYWRGEMETHP